MALKIANLLENLRANNTAVSGQHSTSIYTNYDTVGAPKKGQAKVTGMYSIGGIPVLPYLPDWDNRQFGATQLNKSFAGENKEYKMYAPQTTRKVKLTFAFVTKTELDTFVKFFCSRRGRKEEFYIPSWLEELPPQTVTNGQKEIVVDITTVGFFEKNAPKGLWIMNMYTGQVHFSPITIVTTETTATITLDRQIPYASDNTKLGFCYPVRFDSDTLAIDLKAKGVGTATVSLTEIPTGLYTQSAWDGDSDDLATDSSVSDGEYKLVVYQRDGIDTMQTTQGFGLDPIFGTGIYRDPFDRANLSDPMTTLQQITGGLYQDILVRQTLTDSLGALNSLTGNYTLSIVARNASEVVNMPQSLTGNYIPGTPGIAVFAGSGTAATTNGTGTGASFRNPSGLVFNTSDSCFYVAEYGGHTIRKVTMGGVVTTIAGVTLSPGTTNGTGTGARFSNPRWLALSPDNSKLYISCESENCIRQMTLPGLVVTNLTANGSINGAEGLCVHPSTGDIYAVEFNTHKILKITPAGVISVFAGTGSQGTADGTGTSASFKFPTALNYDPTNDCLLLGENASYAIRKITIPGAVVTTLAGSKTVSGTTDANGTSARFSTVYCCFNDGYGNYYIADDTPNRLIRYMTQSLDVTTIAGQAGVSGNADGALGTNTTNRPHQFAKGSDGKIYFAELATNKIRYFTRV